MKVHKLIKLIVIMIALLMVTNIFTKETIATTKLYNLYTPKSYTANPTQTLSGGTKATTPTTLTPAQTPTPQSIASQKSNEQQTKAFPDVIEILVDYSSSMNSWINLTKSTVSRVLPNIPSTTLVGLRVFGQGCKDFNSLFKLNHCRQTEQVCKFGYNNSIGIINGMNNTLIGSSTPIEYGLSKAIEDFNILYGTYPKKKIILITDGDDTCGGDPCAYIRRELSSRYDVVIDVIIIDGTSKLKCLSDATGGEFFSVRNQNQFQGAFSDSLQSLPSKYKSNEAKEESNVIIYGTQGTAGRNIVKYGSQGSKSNVVRYGASNENSQISAPQGSNNLNYEFLED